MRDSIEPILWLGAWERSGSAWMIRASCLRAGKVVEALVPAERLNQSRAYDIDAMTKFGCESLSLGVDIDDVASLSPLVDPTEVLEQLHPKLQCSAHAIYVGYAGEVPIYFPAALLIRTLWLWSDWVLPALMTPSSLSLYLGPTVTEPPKRVVQAIGGLSYSRSTETHLRRVAWLGLDAKARDSWNSVLTLAYQGSLSLRLPPARLSTWVWGVQVAGGVLACELLTPHLDFWLPDRNLYVQLGRRVHPCPQAPPFRLRTNPFGGFEDVNESGDMAPE
jgi:hypothetical protein